MPVEPGVIDANILVYAADTGAAQHAVSDGLLKTAQNPSTVLYLTSQILCEFYSVVTESPANGRAPFLLAKRLSPFPHYSLCQASVCCRRLCRLSWAG